MSGMRGFNNNTVCGAAIQCGAHDPLHNRVKMAFGSDLGHRPVEVVSTQPFAVD